MRSYVDSSVLVAIYVPEPTSAWARRQVRASGSVPWSQLHDLEVRNALWLLCGRKALSVAELAAVLAQLEDDIGSERLLRVEVDWPVAFARAQALSKAHAARVLCRSLDILHVALAVELGCTQFVSADHRQVRLARLARLRVVEVRPRRAAGGRSGSMG